MAATYDPTLIATNIVDYARARFRDVRNLVGTTVGTPLLLDEEYQGLIARLGPREGLAQAAEAIGATFAQKIRQYAQGGESTVWPDRASYYTQQALSIRTYGIDMTGNASLQAGAPATPNEVTDPRLQLIGGYGSWMGW